MALHSAFVRFGYGWLFKGGLLPAVVSLYAVFFYLRYAVSYRVLQEFMTERGAIVDHARLNRWG